MPRIMLPPPITIPICVAERGRLADLLGDARNTSGWMPKPWSPASASPESLSRMRR